MRLSEDMINKTLKMFGYGGFHLVWSADAIYCKKRGCNCEGCKLNAFSFHCQMKNFVVALVRAIGKPETVQEPTIIGD